LTAKKLFGAVLSVLFSVLNVTEAMAHTYTYTGRETNITVSPGTYEITAFGAQGGNLVVGNGAGDVAGGLGAEIGGQFTFTNPTSLTILVGSHGGTNGTGGGGSFVVQNGTIPLVVAGGGGGSIYSISGGPGLSGTLGGNGSPATFSYPLEIGGYGGQAGGGGLGGHAKRQYTYANYPNTYPIISWGAYGGGGGGGFYTNGGNGYYDGDQSTAGFGGTSFINGGGSLSGNGFGGGGSLGTGGSAIIGGGGGGGGFSGGGGGGDITSGDLVGFMLYPGGGGGGGSYLDASASNSVEVSGTNTGNGWVSITDASILQGFDISTTKFDKKAFPPNQSDWDIIYSNDYDFVVVGTWDGRSTGNHIVARTKKKLGQYLLEGARNAGMETAACCILTWNTAYTGSYQVHQALSEAGAETNSLAFVAIGVEDSDLKWNNATTAGFTFKPSTVNKRIERIADALQAVRSAGLIPIIYSSASGWQDVTGTTIVAKQKLYQGGTTEISGVPLWNYDNDQNPAMNSTNIGYEGETNNILKQYVANSLLPNSMGSSLGLSFGNLIANLDSSTLDAFSMTNPGVLPSPLLTAIATNPVGGATISLNIVVSNAPSRSDAIASRINAAKLTLTGDKLGKRYSYVTTALPIILNTIPASGASEPVTLQFPNPKSYSGTATLNLTLSYGGNSTAGGGKGLIVPPISITIPK